MGDELTYGFLMPFFPLFPILAIIMQIFLAVWLIHMSLVAWIIAPAWVLIGFIIYRFYSRSRATTTEDEILVFEENEAPEGDEYRVMVAVSDADNALSMIRTTHALCHAKDARLELLHMVPVPHQVPLADAYMLEGKEAITEAMLYLAPTYPLSSTIRYCRNKARGIVSAVREKKTDMLIMGWRGYSKSRSFILSSTVDPVIERAPCNVVVLRDCPDQKFKNILVPVAGGPNSAFALEIASILAKENDGQITAFTVESASRQFDITDFVEQSMDKIVLPRDKVIIEEAKEGNVVSAILGELRNKEKDYDLVVMGCTRQPAFQMLRKAPVPETVAHLSGKPIVMVKSSGGIQSWLKRWV